MNIHTLLICPLCKQPLSLDALQKTWRCCNNHCFDKAKEGYVNLLPAQHKHSKSPGDTAESLKARRTFLNKGYYAPLKTAVEQLLTTLEINTLLDIGCGEGYYTQGMASVVNQVYGLDIAKPAVMMAAKSYSKQRYLNQRYSNQGYSNQSHPNQGDANKEGSNKEGSNKDNSYQDCPDKNNLTTSDAQMIFMVATGAQLPILSASIDVVCSLFAPIPIAEICRVLKPNGYLLLVTPAATHLQTMRTLLFETLNPHQPDKFLTELAPYFNCIKRQEVACLLQLPQPDIKALVSMTPYTYRATLQRKQELEALPSLETEAVFQIYLLQKTAKMDIDLG